VATPEIIPFWARAGLVGSAFVLRAEVFWADHLRRFTQLRRNALERFRQLRVLAAFALITALVVAVRRRWPHCCHRGSSMSSRFRRPSAWFPSHTDVVADVVCDGNQADGRRSGDDIEDHDGIMQATDDDRN